MRTTGLMCGSLLAICTGLFPSVSVAQDVGSQESAILAAAQGGFETLLEVTRSDDFNKIFPAFGFDSPSQGANLKLGHPLIVKWIRLDRLQTFDGATTAPKNLLEKTFQALFPILSEEAVVTSLTVGFVQNQKMWKPLQWGPKEVIRGLTKLDQYKKSTSSFVVWIPALHVYFLSDQIAGQLTLIPIADYPRFRLKGGQALPARDVFTQIQQVVQPSHSPHDIR